MAIIVKCVGGRILWYVGYGGTCGLLILEALFENKPYRGCCGRYNGEKLMPDN
jgi:hypothetical protein